MKSFGYAADYNRIMLDTMQVFIGHGNETVRGIPVLDYFTDIYDSISRGKEITNLISYIFSIQDNINCERLRDAAKNTPILNDEEAEDKLSGIPEEKLSREDAYEDIVADIAYNQAIAYIKENYEYYIIHYGVDIFKAVAASLNNVKGCVNTLREICMQDQGVSEAIQTILSSKKDFLHTVAY